MEKKKLMAKDEIKRFIKENCKKSRKIWSTAPIKLIHYLGWAPLVPIEKENIVELKKSFWSIEFLHFLNSIHHRKLHTSVRVLN